MFRYLRSIQPRQEAHPQQLTALPPCGSPCSPRSRERGGPASYGRCGEPLWRPDRVTSTPVHCQNTFGTYATLNFFRLFIKRLFLDRHQTGLRPLFFDCGVPLNPRRRVPHFIRFRCEVGFARRDAETHSTKYCAQRERVDDRYPDPRDRSHRLHRGSIIPLIGLDKGDLHPAGDAPRAGDDTGLGTELVATTVQGTASAQSWSRSRLRSSAPSVPAIGIDQQRGLSLAPV